MMAGRRIKTVDFVAILAVTTFGVLATASARQQAFPTAESPQSGGEDMTIKRRGSQPPFGSLDEAIDFADKIIKGEYPPRRPAEPQHRGDWMIQVGALPDEHAAKQRLSSVQSKATEILTGAEPFTETVDKGGTTYYRARFAGLDKEAAEAACEHLKRNYIQCVTVRGFTPAAANLTADSKDMYSLTRAVGLRHVANLAAAARKGTDLAPSLAHKALEVAQWASQSSAAVAIQLMSTRFASGPRASLRLYTLADAAVTIAERSQTISRSQFAAAQRVGASIGYTLTAEEVQNLLGANEALVFFLVGANESYVFALTREGFEWRTISLGEENVSAKVAAFRRGLDVVELTKSVSMGKAQLFDLAAAHELYVALFGPVETLIKDKPQLLIVPTGPLTALPFHLLVTEKPAIALPRMQSNDMAGYRDAGWLVRRHAVTVLPSVANLKALRVSVRKGQGTKPMIGFGDPVFARDQIAASVGQRASTVKIAARTRAYAEYWQGASVNRAKLAEALPPLPDSADELKAVAAKLGASSSDIHLGRDATEANVKRLPLADYRVVYFATHGLVAGDVEGLGEPSLALTLPNEPSELDDGLLTASEVAQLELNADWVVLSACNTAASEKPGAEALSGLARAFFYAGARALLVSHWGIDSKAAARLSTSTFDIMNSDRTIGRAEALRRAMLAYLDDRSDIWNAYPGFWGSFSLVGEGTVPDAAAAAQATRMPSFVARLFGGGKD
jgi:CHAT domain-containing protein